ncbi:MAG: bifunctional glutamate N-acetyltransferase/amino-acid acetyltransferase ArgJ [Gammaproteobacteria bacterium]|nr:MAG: bifunctional glutamate N-acetyltransferase/amino-acid acetyltransferase ArgJ [Gammaproteobacteria bacterium]
MAVGLEAPKTLLPVAGVRLSSTAAGIRYQGRDDLVLMAFEAGTRMAGVFTRNAFCAAPVLVAREHLAAGQPRYWLINSGNANAGTGAQGLSDARRSCALVAAQAGLAAEAVLPFSTGVIGEPLAVDAIERALPALYSGLSADGWLAAARAIMTTDTVPKGASREVALSSGTVTLTGIAKGAGMIRPDMATMLAFVATDARIEQAPLQGLLQAAVDGSFNRITVDGDTSTNDACMLAATGASGIGIQDPEDEARFAEALNALMRELAHAIVRDGEGATKFVTIEVGEAADTPEALAVAYTVAHSPLVKTALFASDPNWGRILAAVGRSGLADLDVNAVRIWLDDVQIVRDGGRAPEYREEDGQRVMAREEILVRIELGRGMARERVWTCDLSHDYVRINAEYRT